MIKFIVFFSIAMAHLPTVVADPVFLNFTFRCEVPINHWCAEILLWEEDPSSYDVLEYTWQCTSSRTMKFQLSVSPNRDGSIFNNNYELDWKIFTDCTPKYTTKRQPRCRCYPTDGHTSVPSSGEQYLDKHYLFTHYDGHNMNEKVCEFPENFKEGGRNLIGTTALDSPCDQALHLMRP